jgi:hypothetical protein
MVSRLDRTHFSISRAAEYFSVKELAAQTGQPASAFAAVALKELVDNALDAAEAAERSPEIGIEATVAGDDLHLVVSDNGPGLARETLSRILDFSTRTSDKAAYRAPTRGLQGNALKTIIGLPTALDAGAPIVIEAGGVRHTIEARIDPAGNVHVDHDVSEWPTASGTRVALTLPTHRQVLDPTRWARGFALLNPHASVKIRDGGRLDGTNNVAQSNRAPTVDFYPATVDFPEAWRKFMPTDPTAPAWYDGTALRTLVFNHIAAAQRAGAPGLTLGEFIRQFRGLSGTAKAKAVAADLPGIRRLADFVDNEAAVDVLLAAMQREARPPKADVLGWVGPDHLRSCFAAWYGVRPERFWYHRVRSEADGMPYIVEAAVAETEQPGDVFCGINFSPTFTDPLAQTFLQSEKVSGYGVLGFLEEAHVLSTDRWGDAPRSPVAAVLHITCPELGFLDRGKTRLTETLWLRRAVPETLWRAARPVWEVGERKEKDAAKAEREELAREKNRQRETPKWTLKDAAFAVMVEAWSLATGGGSTSASARTVYYQARPLVQRYTDEVLNDTYFTQTLMPAYDREVQELPGVYYEARGTLSEPHTSQKVGLGTREVSDYQFPDWTFDKILFIEKQGLYPPLEAAQLAERYDMAIVAGQGFATVATRKLLQRADQDQTYRLFVLHDADPAGYNIARTLRRETARMPEHRIDIVDLGLRFEEGEAMGLQRETFTRTGSLPKALVLTERERAAFHGTFSHRTAKGKLVYIGERIELNAMTSPQLIDYIESGLKDAAATAKVVPDAATISSKARGIARSGTEAALREAIMDAVDLDAIVAAIADAWVSDAFAEDIAGLTPDAVRAYLERDRTLPWTAAVAAPLIVRLEGARDELRRLVDETLTK